MDARFSDGTTTYDLSDGGVMLREYTPIVGERGKDRVTDSLLIFLSAGSLADQQATKDEINDWLSTAREMWETVSETRIYIEIKQASETDWRRSELLGGRLQPISGTLDSHSQIKQEYMLIVERRNWWEWPEEELPLSIDNSGFATGGVIVVNGGNGVYGFSGGSTVYITGTDITGDPQTPIPVRWELTPYSDPNIAVEEMFVAHNVFADLDPSTDEHMLEGEDGTPSAGVTTDANARSGEMNTIDWAGAQNQTHKLNWTLNGSQLGGLGGRWYRLLMRLKGTFTAPLFAHLSLFSSSYTPGIHNPMAETEEIEITCGDTDYDLLDFGALQLPTFVSSTASEDLELVLRLRTVNSPGSLDIDFVQLSPVDSFHHAKNVHAVSWDASKIILDGRLGRSYMLTYPGDTAIDGFTDVSNHVALWPGRDQWLTFLHKNGGQSMVIDTPLTVQAFYRPRRTTV